MANSFLTNSLDQAAERLWFQNPVQTLSPEVVRPFSWSQVPSRLALYEEDDMQPQQTLAAAGGTQDFSSSYNVSTNINSEYNFDVQQNSTAFVFNYNNTNNTTQVSYTEGDIINNAGDNIINTIVTGTSGATGSVTSLSNPQWDNSAMTITFTSVTSVFANGLITTITNNANVVVTLAKLKTLSDWYDTGLTSSETFGSGVSINTAGTMLEQNYDAWTFSHGLVTAIELEDSVGDISDLVECDP